MTSDSATASHHEQDVPWLSPDQQREWTALLGLLMTLPPALDAQLKREGGVNGFEYQVLAGLAEAPERTRVLSDLAVASKGSLSRLSHALTRLERSGWVERRTCTARAGRHTEARLTEAGLARLREISCGHVREVRRLVVDVLTPEQLAALGEAARAITAATMAEGSEACREISDC